MSENKSFSSLRDFLLKELEHLLTPEEEFINLFDKKAIMEFPYAPEDGVSHIRGEKEMREYFAKIGELLDIDELILDQKYFCADQQTAILEFHCRGRLIPTGNPYHQKYISVITISQGKIMHYKDYWNPDVIRKAQGHDWVGELSDQ